MDGPGELKGIIADHFMKHFREVDVQRPSFCNQKFKKLSAVQSESLVAPFTEAEIKNVV